MRPGQLLSDTEADIDAITRVLWSALPAAAEDPLSARLVAEALIALARAGADDVVSEVLPREHEYDVHCYGTGDIVGGVAVAGLASADGIRCFGNAVAEDAEALVELVARSRSGEERPMLVAERAEAPRFIARTHDLSGPRAALARPAGDRPAADVAPPNIQPVAALAEVLAHLPTREEIAEAVRSALSESTVVVDLEDGVAAGARTGAAAAPAGTLPEAWAAAIADAVHERFVDERRAPRAHDVADLVAGLMPTAAEVADHVADGQLAQRMEQLEGAITAMTSLMESLAGQLTSLQSDVCALRRTIG